MRAGVVQVVSQRRALQHMQPTADTATWLIRQDDSFDANRNLPAEDGSARVGCRYARTSLAVFTLSCGGWPRMGTRI